MRKTLTRPRAREKQSEPKPAADLKPGATRGEAPTSAPSAPSVPDPELARLAADRVVIENVSPEVNCGRFPAKAAVGDCFTVEADIFADGHDKIDAAFLFRRADEADWQEVPMAYFDNGRWRGFTLVEDNTRYRYTLIAWRDLFASWRDEVSKKHAAGVPIALELTEGRKLVEKTLAESDRVGEADREPLQELVAQLEATPDEAGRLALMMTRDTAELMKRAGIRTNLSRYERELELTVDRKRAAFSAW